LSSWESATHANHPAYHATHERIDGVVMERQGGPP